MAKTILLTGAGGYIGSRMVEKLLERGDKVVALDRYFFGDVFEDIKDNNQLTIVKDDIRFFDKHILSGVDVVIDLASISNDPASELVPSLTREINHEGAVRVAKLSKEVGVEKFIFSSSCSIYGHGQENKLNEESEVAPVSEYAKCKIAAEKEILDSGDENFSVTSLRNATVYGLSTRRMRFDLIINIMTLHAWKSGKIFVLGGGKQWRPLVHIDDVIKAFLLITDTNDFSKINKQVFNVGSNEQNYQVFQIAQIIKNYFPDSQIEVTPDDPDARTYNVDFSKISDVLGYKTDKNVNDGILEIKKSLDEGLIIFDDKRTSTLGYYKFLMEADEILKHVKLNGKLF